LCSAFGAINSPAPALLLSSANRMTQLPPAEFRLAC
jgi:hypothetical protein